MILEERSETKHCHEKGCQVMPGGVSSPVRSFNHLDMLPLVIKSGKGDLICDVDGREYIDFCMAWGSLLLGHSPQIVVDALQEQLSQGTSFGLTTPYETTLAETIQKHLPSMEKMRFVSSGTEATMTAIRLARGYTDKPVIIKFDGHYHGHSDSLLVSAGSGVTHLPNASSQGIPEEITKCTLSLPFNDLETFCQVLDSREDIAAVIMEPVAGNMGVVPSDHAFIQGVRKKTEERGVLLILDEVITGFRVGLSGAQGLYGVSPDLTCLGKVIGGGFPVAAVGGQQEIMDKLAPLGPIYQAGTLSGNPLAMLAGQRTLEEVATPRFYERLAERTEAFLAPIRLEILKRNLPVTIQSQGSMFTLFFGVSQVRSKADLAKLDVERFNQFFRFMCDAGVHLSPSAYEAHFLSTAHTDSHLEYTRGCILKFLRAL